MTIKQTFTSFPEVWDCENGNMFIIKSPTMNCQTYSIANMEFIIARDNLKELLIEIQERVQKNQILLDVGRGWVEKLDKVFPKEDFLIRSDYVNSTGSKMTMCLIKTTAIKSQKPPIV